MRTAYERGAVQSRTQTICFVVHARKTAEDLGTSAAPCRFSARDSEYSLPSSDVTTLISRCCDFQIAVSSTSRNRFFNPPYFRLLACAKSSLLYLQQSRWVLWCTHVGRMMAFSLQHGFWPTRNVPASISVSTVIRKERFLNDKPLKRSNLILQRWNQWRNSKIKFASSQTPHSPWAYSREHSPWQVSALDSHFHE